jgi:hypothetical protein
LRELTYYIGTPSSKSPINSVGMASAWTVDSGHHPLLQGAYQSWMAKLSITEGVTNLQVSFFWRWRAQVNGATVTKPDWLTALTAAGAVRINSGAQVFWTQNTTSGSGNVDSDQAEIHRYDCLIEGKAISRSLASATVLRDPGDYGTTAPPSNLANDLLAAQAFVPYDGQFGLSPYETPVDLLTARISFGGLTARLASIGALVQSETLTVATGAKSVVLGLPARQGATALGRLRKLGS